MTLLLAQTTQPLSHEMIGLIVVTLVFLSRWLWDYNRQRREESAQYEPKVMPALHKEYATKVEVSKLETDLKTALTELATLVRQEAISQAGKRKKIYENTEALGRDMASMRSINESQTRQLHSLETKLENMPDKILKLINHLRT